MNIAVLVGESGQPGDAAKGIRRAFYTFMQEYGWTVGRRIRKGGKTVGYRPAAGRFGGRGVHKVPGKHFTRGREDRRTGRP